MLLHYINFDTQVQIMSTSARYAQLVNAASMNNDRAAMLDAYYQYQDTACLHPVSVKIKDNHTQTMRTIEVSCGHCWHCKQSKINEWCTRMYAHAEDFKNVYFVTLTYRSISDPNNQVNQLLLNKLGQAVWHRDALNATHHMSYNPCLLVKKHYQDFLKRLRKNTGLSDLTYVVSGEYGHTYGRPHFHFILFTNGTLTKQDIVRAWSVALWKSFAGSWSYRKNQVHSGTAYDFPIGRVDFHDLVSNGTFNKDMPIRIDGTYMKAANCFAYVCKYVCKQDSANLSRVDLSYNNLFHKETVVALGDDEVKLWQIRQWLLKNSISFTNDRVDDLKQLSYEKTVYEPSEDVSQHGLLRVKRVEKQNYSFDFELLPSVYYEFRDRFRPFCEFSRGTPIGCIYAKRNIQEFAKGVFTKPLLQTDGFTVPKYFYTKAHDYLYGLRKVHKTIKGNSLVLSGLVNLQRRLSIASKDPSSLRENLGYSLPYSLISEALHDDRKVFVNSYTKERILVYNDHAQHYKFDRHSRCYRLTRAVPVADWIRDQLVRLQDELKRNQISTLKSLDSRRLKERADLMLLDHGFDLNTIKQSYIIRQDSIKRSNDLLYHESHVSAE